MDENAGSTNSLRNLPVGRMGNIRKMFETGGIENPTESNPIYTSSEQAAVPDNIATPPKPTPRVKPKLSELPAKPKIYSVPIYKPPLNATNNENNSSQHAVKPQISPKKISTSGPGKPKASVNTNQQASPRRSTNEQDTTQNNCVNSDITSELEVRLRRRQDGNAIRKQCHRKSEPDFNASNNLPKPIPSPKRFSGNFDKSSRPNSEQVEMPPKPRSSSDNSVQEEPIGKIDISQKAKIFEGKKIPPERPAVPKIKPGHVRQKSTGSVPEYARVNKLPSVPHPVSMVIKKDEESQQVSPRQPLPPSKPPRTHAHDQYLLTKIKKEEVIIDENVLYQSLEEEKPKEEENIFTMPIRERISQMNQLPHSQDDSKRLNPPARPPPPKQRHVSDLRLSTASNSVAKEMWFFPKEPPEIPDSKPPLEVYESALPFKKYGTLPRKPKTSVRRNRPFSDESDQNTDSMKRFPLRKSLSSECLQRKEKSTEHYYEDPTELMMRDVPYEAYVDQEGYAVPNKFVKVKLADRFSEDPNMAQDRPFGEALKARFDDLKKRIVPENKSSSSSSSQTSEDPVKVNRKCRNFVRDRINQAFSVVRRYVRRKSESGLDVPNALDSESLSDDSDSFVDVCEIIKRKTYASTIRKKTSPSVRKSVQFVDKIYPQLFEYAVIVGLRPFPADQGYEPYIIHKFPEIRNYKVSTEGHLYVCINMVDSNVSVPLFCFPDANDYKVEKNLKSEKYSFVLTNFDGGRVYGYCKRLQMPNCNLPEVICIISPIEANNMYNILLNEVGRKRMQSLELAQELLAASFGRPLPKPGHDVQIRSLDVEGELETIHLHRPSDARLENVQYECLLTYLGTDKLIKTFSALLLERRVILCSNSLSTLTHVVQAVVALLYPFHWEHVYIPILPEAMLDVCCSPTPFIIGILSSHLPHVLDKPLDEVLIIDLDKKTVIESVGDESTLLPKNITKALKMAINMCKIDIEAERSQALMISEAFLRVFVETVGHYGEFITTQQDNKKVFLKENFIAKLESQGLQQFLEWFTETQMFEVFITNHLEKRDWGTVDVFMTRVMEYKDGLLPQAEKSGLGIKVKNFGKAIKSKLT